ncbi:MAG: ATP-grasp domain-containing protein [Candidatus Bathyarchaeota archaeon]|nr:ATP-grasp domain-containing protein [Candidatus Bathyarchaeota archaeon]
MNLLIAEYFSGGGYSNTQLSSSILCEAYGMLRTLISDCKTAGHNVTTFLDKRLDKLNAPNQADQTFVISSSDELFTELEKLSREVDAVYVIGPESDRILEKMVKTVEASGGTSLNCESDAINRVSNKMTFYESAKKLGLKTPETVLVNSNDKLETIKSLTKQIGYPLVFKPLDGVGCGGLSVVSNEADVETAVKKVVHESSCEDFVVQKLVTGQPASVCVFSNGTKAVAASLNKQFVLLESPDKESKYFGGVVPFDHKLARKAFDAAKKVVLAQKELKGYIGVDLVLTDQDPFVIEINPRLTVSYIGLRQTVNFNPAQAIVDAVTDGELPVNVKTNGYCYFSKIAVQTGSQVPKEVTNTKTIVVPPFPIEEKTVYALISEWTKNSRGEQSG